MRWVWLFILLAAAFTLATLIEPGFRGWSHRPSEPQGVMAALMGDSRRLFANHFFVEADVYLHSGYYPSIFDQAEDSKRKDRTSQALHESGHEHEQEPGHVHDEHCEHDYLGRPRNWLDAFGRNFFPSTHTHLGENQSDIARAREMLPWIKFSAELDPQRVETYTVGAYWLRQMHRDDEALRFLREGLRACPSSYAILFELGACYERDQDYARARNIWELALHRWQEQQSAAPDPDHLTLAEILTRLARLEVQQNRRDQAVSYLELLRRVSPFPAEVRKRIEEVKAGQPFEAEVKGPSSRPLSQ